MIIFNEAKPKYERLDQVFEDYIRNIKFSNNVNFIIDLKEIFRKFFRPDLNTNLENRKALIEEISSDILNTIGHYRNYFYKNGKYSTFYILYSYNKCTEILNKYLSYKKDYYEKYFNDQDERCEIIKSSAKVIEKVAGNLPHTKFIDTSRFDEFVYGRYIQSVANTNDINVILTNDMMFSQLINENTILLTMKGIRSEVVNEKNLVSILSEGKEDFEFNISLVPLLFSLSGVKKYNIDGIIGTGISRSINLIKKLIETKKLIENESISFPITFESLNPKIGAEKKILDNKEILMNNFSLVKLDYIFYNKSNELIMMNSVKTENKIKNYTTFKELNSKIFTMYPLNLDMLFKGETK